MSMIMLLGVLVLVVVLPAAVVIGVLSARVSSLKREVEQLRRDACAMPHALNVPFERVEFSPPPLPYPNSIHDDAQLRGFIRSGQKIQAIKLYRERTGVGLKEAKDAIEAMTDRGY